MSQTSYRSIMLTGRPGLPYDVGVNDYVSKLASLEIPFGRFTVKGTSVDLVKLPTSSAEVADALDPNRGFAVSTQALEQVQGAAFSSYKSGDAVSVMKKGRIYASVETTWAAGGKVYVRHTASSTLSNLGILRASSAGTAQLNTIGVGTPVANIPYMMQINGVNVVASADGTPTATEVKDAFVAAINADAILTASVSASSVGASEFALFANSAGIPFTLAGLSEILVNTASQANVSHVEELVGAKFLNSGDPAASTLAVVEFDLV